jgi:hypothetical protein
MTPETGVRDLGKSIFLIFKNFNSFEVLGCLGAYIPSFGLKIHQPHGLVVVGVGLLTVRSSVQYLWGAELQGLATPVRRVLSRHARTVDWSPIGTRNMSLSVRHSQSLQTWKWCLREKKQNFGIPLVPASWDMSRTFYFTCCHSPYQKYITLYS